MEIVQLVFHSLRISSQKANTLCVKGQDKSAMTLRTCRQNAFQAGLLSYCCSLQNVKIQLAVQMPKAYHIRRQCPRAIRDITFAPDFKNK